jgi:hypothetical protein
MRKHHLRRSHRLHCSRFAFVALSILVSSSMGWTQYGPFSELNGSWTGGGIITFDDGRKERISCKAEYTVTGDGNELGQTLRCAGDTPFDLKSNVIYRGGILSGTWSESNFKAAGQVEGRAGGGHFEIKVRTDTFDAKLELTTYGNVQSVRISSNKEMRDVAIRLVRTNSRTD